MKLTFKDLKQQKFFIDAEPSDTIAQLKEKIFAEKGWEASLQKLIYSGKILADDKTVESYNIEEKGFVVCMVSKPKAVPASASSSRVTATPAKVPSTPAQPTIPATPAAPAQSSAGSSVSAVPETPTPAGPSAPNFNDPSALAMGEVREGAIRDMEAMGFERNEIERAMRAAFFNPDRAVDYLLNGIPEHLQQGPHVQQARQSQPQAPPPVAQPQSASGPAAPASEDTSRGPPNPENINLFEAAAAAAAGQRPGGGARGGAGAGAEAGAGGLGNLDFLRNNPQFQQLRQVVQQQPQMLEPILQQVGVGNPQLAALISQNPDAFLQLLSEDAGDDAGDDEGAPLPPGAQQISVTTEERDAIERLCRLGFDRNMVIQAYFACDKNEELAANFLFEHPDDDMDG